MQLHTSRMTVLLLLLVALNGCSCDGDRLSGLCPPPEELGTCVVIDPETGEYERRIAPQIGWELRAPASCRLGQETCNPRTLKITCEGYVPQATEICDLVDNDCDGEVDEGLMIAWSEEENDCDEILLGVCSRADKICIDGSLKCIPVIPVSDDGVERRECWTGPADAIFDDSTTCATGWSYCEAGEWSPCRDQNLPEDEICGDGYDNDCDGVIDIDIPYRTCGPSSPFGQCERGHDICVGAEVECSGETWGFEEICDGIDNDCDNETDEDSNTDSGRLEQLCQNECGLGIAYCEEGGWNCTAPTPSLEICDGVDNDCDDEVDEGCFCTHGSTQSCRENMFNSDGTPSEEQCGIGTQICEFGVWGNCVFLQAWPEECNNWDDDCDLVVDDFYETCGPEEGDEGECNLGTNHCANGIYEGCEEAHWPEDESCDGLDNDCDGDIDEDLDPDDKVDMVFAIDISGSMCQEIDAITAGISIYVADFQDTEHLFGLVVFGAGTPTAVDVVTFPALVDVNTFLAVLSALGCSGTGTEASYDALLYLTDPADPLQIGWREDATPYVILVTDEPPQTLPEVGTTENDVAPQTFNCQIGNCEQGEQVEVFVISPSNYWLEYDFILFSESDRFFNIEPATEEHYHDILTDIFTNVCLYQNDP